MVSLGLSPGLNRSYEIRMYTDNLIPNQVFVRDDDDWCTNYYLESRMIVQLLGKSISLSGAPAFTNSFATAPVVKIVDVVTGRFGTIQYGNYVLSSTPTINPTPNVNDTTNVKNASNFRVVSHPTISNLFSIAVDGGDSIATNYLKMNNPNRPVSQISVRTNSIVFTGSISGTTLTVTLILPTAGKITEGNIISGAGIAVGTFIVAYLTGSGGIGTYLVSESQSVPSTTITENDIHWFSFLPVAENDKILSYQNGNERANRDVINADDFNIPLGHQTRGVITQEGAFEKPYLGQFFFKQKKLSGNGDFENSRSVVDAVSYIKIKDDVNRRYLKLMPDNSLEFVAATEQEAIVFRLQRSPGAFEQFNSWYLDSPTIPTKFNAAKQPIAYKTLPLNVRRENFKLVLSNDPATPLEIRDRDDTPSGVYASIYFPFNNYEDPAEYQNKSFHPRMNRWILQQTGLISATREDSFLPDEVPATKLTITEPTTILINCTSRVETINSVLPYDDAAFSTAEYYWDLLCDGKFGTSSYTPNTIATDGSVVNNNPGGPLQLRPGVTNFRWNEWKGEFLIVHENVTVELYANYNAEGTPIKVYTPGAYYLISDTAAVNYNILSAFTKRHLSTELYTLSMAWGKAGSLPNLSATTRYRNSVAQGYQTTSVTGKNNVASSGTVFLGNAEEPADDFVLSLCERMGYRTKVCNCFADEFFILNNYNPENNVQVTINTQGNSNIPSTITIDGNPLNPETAASIRAIFPAACFGPRCSTGVDQRRGYQTEGNHGCGNDMCVMTQQIFGSNNLMLKNTQKCEKNTTIQNVLPPDTTYPNGTNSPTEAGNQPIAGGTTNGYSVGVDTGKGGIATLNATTPTSSTQSMMIITLVLALLVLGLLISSITLGVLYNKRKQLAGK